MSLRRIILLASICLGLTCGVVSLLLVVLTSRLRGDADQLRLAVESVHVSEQIQLRLFEFNRELFLAHLTEKPEHLRNVNREINLLNTLLKESRNFITSPEEEKIVGELHSSIDNFIITTDKQDKGSAVDLYLQRLSSLQASLEQASRLTELNLLQSRATAKKAAVDDRMANAFGLISGLILIFVMGFVWFGLRKWIYRPVAELSRAIASFSEKEDARAPEVGLKEFAMIGQRFNELAERLVEQRKTQLQFLASVAHDLRNPLGAIQMASEVLIENDVSNEVRREFGAIVRRQAKHLNRLVSDLLDSSRIEAGRLELHKSSGDVVELVRDAVTLYESISKIHKLKFTTSAPKIQCQCDVSRISQVLNNLLNNAIKYSPNGGPVEVRVSEKHNYAVIEVKDEGIGISPEDLPHIFEPFRRTKLTKLSIPGVGLGLSVTRKIVEAHGATLVVESSVGKGTVFRIEMPVGDVVEPKIVEPAPSWN